jgi:hypothetical protein
MKKWIFLLGLSIFVIFFVYRFFTPGNGLSFQDIQPQLNNSEVRSLDYRSNNQGKVGGSEEEEIVLREDEVAREKIPERYLLAVPFTTQAPFADWGEPYQEACEEAALIMASSFFAGRETFSKLAADEALLGVVAWEKGYFGSYEHTDTLQTAEMARVYFGLSSEILRDLTVEKIKSPLLIGKIVIVPTAGRELFNPYYSGIGPLYHMLLIRGWDETGFVTNDPGTKRGEKYHYPYDILMKAIHDWNGGDIYAGEAEALAVWRE